MIKTRVIPVLLLKNKGLVKTVNFKDPKYIGDPINSIRIFNEKEVDELTLLDITASIDGRGPDFELLEDVAGEAFMPMGYGGGITDLDQVKKVFSLGFEKVIINSSTFTNYDLLKSSAQIYGGQSIVASIDCKKSLLGKYEIFSHSGERKIKISLSEHLRKLEECEVGEIVVNSIDRDGKQKGYDLKLIEMISSQVSVPVVACGGAGSLSDFAKAVNEAGASAVAAGSLFVFKGKHRAVLISYPSRSDLCGLLP